MLISPNKLKVPVYLLALAATNLAAAQMPKDGELWQGIALEYELGDKWDLEFEQQFRLEQNMSTMRTHFLESGLQYKASDFIDFKLQYRYSFNPGDHNERRYAFDTNLHYDIPNNPIDINYRLRIQDGKVAYTGEKRNYLRNEIGLDANLTKLVDPFVSFEHFFLIRPDKEKPSETRTYRYTIGLEWKIEDDLSLDTYFRRDQERNVELPEVQYILGIMIKYEI